MMASMGMSFASIWLLQLGVFALLDALLFKRTPAGDARPAGPVVWGIFGLVIGGIGGLWGLYGLYGAAMSLQWIADAPLLILNGLLSVLVQVALSVFLILRGIARLRRARPPAGVVALVLAIAAMGLALLGFVLPFLVF